jgi:periplasmic divalent cation tolerance protein
MKMRRLIVFVTCNGSEEASQIARTLVEEKKAACANIIAGIRSIYRWQGKVHDDPEALLLIKTTDACYDALEKRIVELHSNDVPEIVAVDIAQGLPAYLEWVVENTAAS